MPGFRQGGGSLATHWPRVVAAPLILAVIPACAAAQTAAGTAIVNTAELQADASVAIRSNSDRIVVAERLDVTLAAPGPIDDRAVRFVVTNIGSGAEGFAIGATADGAAVPIAADTDGDGRYDSAIDQVLDGRTSSLPPGGTAGLWVLAPADADALTLSAQALTGAGDAGMAFAGAGDGGGDAVVGSTGAQATLTLTLGRWGVDPVLVKSQSVVVPGGGTFDGRGGVMAGAIVTYSLDARFGGEAADAVIEDPLPPGTTAVAGSLRLDNRPLSDAADADAGEITGNLVRVRLGDGAAGTRHTVSFAVRVN